MSQLWEHLVIGYRSLRRLDCGVILFVYEMWVSKSKARVDVKYPYDNEIGSAQKQQMFSNVLASPY